MRSDHSGRSPRRDSAASPGPSESYNDVQSCRQLPRPGAQVLHVRPRVGVMVGKVRKARTSAPSRRSVRRNASGLPRPQNAATGRPRSASSGAVSPSALTSSDGRCVVSITGTPGASRCDLLPQSSALSASPTWSQRVRMTRCARRRPRAARAASRAAAVAVAPGRVASISTRSRSRASRRCWKPSSSTRISLSSSSMAARARATRSAPCRCGTSGRFSSSTSASSLRPALAAVAAAEDGHAQVAAGDRSGPRIRRTASCRCRRRSGCRR